MTLGGFEFGFDIGLALLLRIAGPVGIVGALRSEGGADSRGLGRVGQRRYLDRKSTRLNSSHIQKSRMPSSA